MVPETDFPDIRAKTAIHSRNGSSMVIPRENDLIRPYVQMNDADVLNAEGRVDKSRVSPEKLLAVAQQSFKPYHITTKEFDWWTIYMSELLSRRIFVGHH